MPPDSLLRAADESALRTIQQEINHRLFVWVKQWRCVDPNRLAGIALNPVSDDEARAFVAAHVHELREQPGALPDRLKRQYEEVQARLPQSEAEQPRNERSLEQQIGVCD